MKNKDGRDNELDQLLKPLKKISPDDLQMHRWQSAVKRETLRSSQIYSASRTKWAVQLVAAMFVGVVIGAVAFKNNQPSVSQPNVVAQISLDDATFERSHANLD